jgi:hypothetical protein
LGILGTLAHFRHFLFQRANNFNLKNDLDTSVYDCPAPDESLLDSFSRFCGRLPIQIWDLYEIRLAEVKGKTGGDSRRCPRQQGI